MSRQRFIQTYMWTVIALGVVVCTFSAYQLPLGRFDVKLALLALVTVAITSRISIPIPRLTSEITVSDTFVFLIMLLYGGEAAVLVAAAEALCSASRISRKPRTLLYNAAVLGCATFLTAQVWNGYLELIAPRPGLEFSAEFLMALCGMVFVQYGVNSGLASIYESLKSDRPLWETWSRHYLWTSVTYVAGASGAAITAKLIDAFGFYTFLVTTPTIGIVYFTYRVYLANVKTAEAQAEQARRHVEELNHYIAEQERIREQFSQVEKLSALGQMASGVAHDFNNSLAAILGRAELLMKHTQDQKTRRGLEIIAKSARDGANTVKRIQDFARQRRDRNFELITVDQLLVDVGEITRPRWKDSAEAANVHISLELRNNSCALVLGDASELRDVLVNMVFNAVDAMRDGGGALTLSSEAAGDRVVLSVADTGTGMSPEVRSRIFDPFFTTKGVEGMGLGLAVGYGIISRHDGTITVESEIGRGTTFKIELPFAGSTSDAPAEAGSGVAASARARGKDMTKILVVDDEAPVRELIREILEDDGYAVEVAASGPEGLALFDRGEFDAVFTDVGMPGMSGWELARAIRERDARLPIAVITGWGEMVGTNEKESACVDWVVTKPFTMEQIGEIAQEVSRRRISAAPPLPEPARLPRAVA